MLVAALALSLLAASAGAQALPASTQRKAPPDPSSLARYPARPVLALLGGIGSAALGGVIGAAALAAACPHRNSENCLSPALAGFYSGVLFSFPVGAYLVGLALRGRGSFLLTVALPWAFAIAGVAAAFSDDDAMWDYRVPLLVGGLVAMNSSLVLYELTSGWNARRRATGRQPIALRPLVQPRAAGLSLIAQL